MLVVCMYNLIGFKKPRFSPSGTRKRETGVLKNLHFERRIWKPAFSLPGNAVLAEAKKKISVSKHVRIRVNGEEVGSWSAKRATQLLSGKY